MVGNHLLSKLTTWTLRAQALLTDAARLAWKKKKKVPCNCRSQTSKNSVLIAPTLHFKAIELQIKVWDMFRAQAPLTLWILQPPSVHKTWIRLFFSRYCLFWPWFWLKSCCHQMWISDQVTQAPQPRTCSALSRPYSCEFYSGTINENQNCAFQARFGISGHGFSSRALKSIFSREQKLPKTFSRAFSHCWCKPHRVSENMRRSV